MPLLSGKKASTKSGFNENVKREIQAGKPLKQALAIANSKEKEYKSNNDKK